MGKRRKHGRVVYTLFLFLYMFLIALAALYALKMVWDYAEEYELSRSSHTLDAYLESGDYRSFSSYITYNGIRTYGTVFEKYTNVSWCADAYSSFVLHLESLFLQTDRDRWLQYSASNDIRWLCQSLDDFLDDYESAQRNEESELYLGYIEDMRQTMGQMLHVYLGIDEQELAEFLTLSENRKAVYVEEVLLNAQKAG